MALKDEYDFDNLINEAERLVLEELQSQINENNNICGCQDCVLDMAAFALNKVKPYYRVSLLGSLYARSIDRKYEQDVHNAVQEAVKKVQSNPSHD